jgi:DNA-binding SARP family transcriptional activator
MRFRLLGPLEIVSDSGRGCAVSAARQRVVLSMLLLDGGTVVSAEQLADALWEHTPPITARGQVQICVSALRKTLAKLGLADRIVTRPPGYLITVADGELDLHEFDRMTAQAQQAAAGGRLHAAAAAYDEALALWQGSALADVESRALHATVARLEERRLATIEDRIDVELRRGHHQAVVGELRELIAAHPLRERLHAQQMRALAGAGRQAEALAAYRSARRMLVDELGLEPGRELRRLERVILTGGEPAPQAPDPPDSGPAPGPVSVPHLLPVDPGLLTGREGPLAAVRAAAGNRSTAPVVAISGPPGAGASALAVHAAHTLVPAFTDGQLYARLRGPDDHPLDPAGVLGRFLRALGVRRADIPDGLDERAELYRDQLAGGHVLIVLDDAADERQVLPLIPGSPGCSVLVTSHRRLTGLTGAYRVHLAALRPPDAVRLLAGVLGRPRVDAEPDAAAELAALCDCLPLALRVCAARLAARPHWTLEHLVSRLRDPARRLDELSAGPLDVRARFATGLDGLSPTARALFCKLPATTGVFGSRLATRLLPGHHRAEDALEELVDAQLVTATAGPSPRYRLAGLARLFAAECAPQPNPTTTSTAESIVVSLTGGCLLPEEHQSLTSPEL